MVNEHLFKIRIKSDDGIKIIPSYLFYFWFSSEGRAELENSVAGSAQGGISLERLKKTRIPLPSLADQEALVAKLHDMNVTQGYSFRELL